MSELRDYVRWHDAYDDPESGLSWRLRQVQLHLRAALDRHPGTVRVLSVCSGDGRDVISVLAGRSDSGRVSATLLELSPQIAAAARASAAGAGLGSVEVRTVDAGTTDAYAGAVPADVVLLVGIFGNVSAEDVRATIAAAPSLCAPGATLLWSLGRGRPVEHASDSGEAHRGDPHDAVRRWFADAGFSELGYATIDTGSRPALGVVRYDGPPQQLVPGRRLFTFLR